MAGRETADIVFCIDVSGSMRPAIDGVKRNIKKLVEALKGDLQIKWDVRLDFIAHSTGETLSGKDVCRIESINCKGEKLIDAVYGKASLQSSPLFTSDIDSFCEALSRLECGGDECTVPMLDIAADFPFRDAATCHRVIVLLTDEPVDDGVYVSQSKAKLMELAQKLQSKKIALYMTTPDCPVFDTLSQVDKCEWNVDSSRGLEGIDFTKLMQSIGKSVSMSQTNAAEHGGNAPKPLYNESAWKSVAVGESGCSSKDAELYVVPKFSTSIFGAN